jgi:membrane-bound serine protease (ClpP class)
MMTITDTGHTRKYAILVSFLALALSIIEASCAFAAAAPSITSPDETAGRTLVYIAELDGVVGVPVEEHMESVFQSIGKGENSILILKMNTPGGLVDSMSEIIGMIAEADYPVVVWVAPSGARAASAGAFIVQSAHVAVMAPGTNIGAAHPVTGGGDISEGDLKKKVVNDLTAKMRSFAQERGRNVKASESMVSESVSLTAREALEKNVIDFIAKDEDELLEKLDGRKVKVKERSIVISTADRETTHIDMPFGLRVLELFSRPDMAYLALIGGIFLIILEAKAPGGFVMGLSGGILLLIASYGLRVLPVNLAGVALLVGGIVIIILDIAFGGIGILAATGIASMLFGGLMLFRAPGGELLNMSAGFVVGVTMTLSIFFLCILRLICKALVQKPSSGMDAMIGANIKISGKTEKGFMAFIHGEYWRVLPLDPIWELAVGDEVKVVKVESRVLFVKPMNLDGKFGHDSNEEAPIRSRE